LKISPKWIFNKYFLVMLTMTFFFFLKSEPKIFEKIVSPTPWIKSRNDFLKVMPKNGVVAEIGVLIGENAESILLYCSPKHLYLIDIWRDIRQYHEVKNMFRNDSRVTVIRADSAKAAKLFEDGFFDWVYIDGEHRYEFVKKDLNVWFKKIKCGGILAGHDYVNPLEYEWFGVVQAVNEFIVENKLKMIYLSTDYWASFAIKKE